MMLAPKTTHFISLLVGVLCSSSIFAFENDISAKPGLLVRVTKPTFDYVTNIAIDQAVKEVKTHQIPNQRGKIHDIEYYISRMKVLTFDIESHSVGFVPNKGMHYRFAGINLAISGRLDLKKWFARTHTYFNIKENGVNIAMDIYVVLDTTTGRPKVYIGECHANVPKPRVSFRGGSSWILKWFSGYFEKIIQSTLQEKICSSSIIKDINTEINKGLQNIPNSENFLGDFTFDFRLLKNPDIKTTFMDSEHKGEVFWINNHKECPLPVRPMEALPVSTTKSMATVQLSTYSLNSFAYVAYKNKYIHYIFNSKNIPQAGLLNTTCQNICIGKLIPELAKAYPNKEVSILLEGTEMPEPNITNGYLMLDATIDLTIYLSTDSPNKPLLILPIKVHTESTANIMNQVVHYNVSVLKLKLGMVKKSMPIKINVEQLQHTINFGINAVLMPQINKKGNQGFAVPEFSEKVKLMNTKFGLGVNSAIFMTDFRLNHNFGYTEKDDSWHSSLVQSFGYAAYYILSSIVSLSSSALSINI